MVALIQPMGVEKRGMVRQALMASPGLLAVAADLKSTLLDGIGPTDLKTILAAAKPRQFVANSVIFNQANPAEHLYLLTCASQVLQLPLQRRFGRPKNSNRT